MTDYWKLAEKLSKQNNEIVLVWEPAKINEDGSIENITQGSIVMEGPKQGHWAMVNGKRKWIEGQHNYKRQRDPRNPDLAIIGTRLMNQNPKVVIESGIDELQDKEKQKRYLVDNARIIRLGKTTPKRVFKTYQDKGFDFCLRKAAAINAANTQLANTKPTAREITGVSELGELGK